MKSYFHLGLILMLILALCSGCADTDDPLLTDTAASSSTTLSFVETEFPTIETEIPTLQTETTPTETEPSFRETEGPTAPPLLTDAEPGAHLLRYESEKSGEYMDYYLFVPNNPVENMPIVTFLHGSGEVGHVEKLEDYGIVTVVKALYGEDFPFLLLLPCTHKPTWTRDSVPETLIELIDSVVARYRADRNRVGITGHSLGAVGTWKMISQYSDYFSAAVPVSGGADGSVNYAFCAKVPVMAFVGTAGEDEEEYNSVMRKLVDGINKAGGNAQLHIVDGGDHKYMVTAAYTKDLFDWLLTQ